MKVHDLKAVNAHCEWTEASKLKYECAYLLEAGINCIKKHVKTSHINHIILF